MFHFNEFLFVMLAVAGGVARYLNGFAGGAPFRLSVFLASAFVAGFSGYIFALTAITFGFSIEVQFIFAGIGGFFGEQSLKLVYELVERKLK